MDLITNENPVSQTTDDLQSSPPRPDTLTLTQNNVQHISHESIDVTCCYNFYGVCKNVVSCLNTPSDPQLKQHTIEKIQKTKT